MADENKAKRQTGKDAKIAEPGTPGALGRGDLERNPAGTPGMGRQTGEGIARVRDQEATAGGMDVPVGFVGTGSSGSQSGRAQFGIAQDDKVEDVDSLGKKRDEDEEG